MKRIPLYFSTVVLLAGVTLAQQPQTPKATIEGTVTRAGTGQPLKNAKVTLSRATPARNAGAAADPSAANTQNRLNNLLAGAPVVVNTDASGRFTITGVDPGDYRISADREGFIRSEYGQRTPTGSGVTVKLAANQRFTATLQMVQASVINGRVITIDGDPSANTAVQAYAYRYSNGQRTLGQVSNTQTNDLGEYRLFGLEPGEYFVSVTSPELADQTPVGAVDISQRRGANGAGRGGTDVAQTLGTIAAALGERGGAIAQVLGGTSNPPVYYPGTLDPDGATSVPVGISSETRGIDFNLRPSRGATVSGRVTAPFALGQSQLATAARGGRGARAGQGDAINNLAQMFLGQTGLQVNLNRIGSARTGRQGLIGLRLGSTPVSADGSFEIKGLAPGPYNLTATGRDPNGQEYTAKARVDVGSADVGNVVIALRPGVEIRGKVVLETAAPLKMTSLRVSLVAEDAALPGLLNLAAVAGGGRGGGGANAQLLGGGGQLATETVAEDGTFTLKNVGSQEYRVRVTGLPQGAYIQSGRIGSNDALNAAFSVDNAQSILQLQIGFSAGRVSGAVSDPQGNAAAGAQVVLVPDETRRGRNDAYFTVTSDQSGQFTLNNVPPGSYKLFAWEDIPAGAYQYPDFIKRYEDRGQAISVNPNGTITANAKLIPAQ